MIKNIDLKRRLRSRVHSGMIGVEKPQDRRCKTKGKFKISLKGGKKANVVER